MLIQGNFLPHIPVLAQRRPANTTTHAYIGVSGPSVANTAHGFGIVFTDEGGSEIEKTSFKSAPESTHMRGALGATLTSIEFAKANLKENASMIIHCKDEYIWRHLRRQIQKWVSQPKRANIDLLDKIYAALSKRIQIDLVAIGSEVNCLAGMRAVILANQAKNGGGGFCFQPEWYAPGSSNAEMMRRALARDKY
jgi:hypothetical protein